MSRQQFHSMDPQRQRELAQKQLTGAPLGRPGDHIVHGATGSTGAPKPEPADITYSSEEARQPAPSTTKKKRR